MFEGRKYTFRSQYGISKDIEWEINAFLSWRLIENKQSYLRPKYLVYMRQDSKKLKKDMGT